MTSANGPVQDLLNPSPTSDPAIVEFANAMRPHLLARATNQAPHSPASGEAAAFSFESGSDAVDSIWNSIPAMRERICELRDLTQQLAALSEAKQNFRITHSPLKQGEDLHDQYEGIRIALNITIMEGNMQLQPMVQGLRDLETQIREPQRRASTVGQFVFDTVGVGGMDTPELEEKFVTAEVTVTAIRAAWQQAVAEYFRVSVQHDCYMQEQLLHKLSMQPQYKSYVASFSPSQICGGEKTWQEILDDPTETAECRLQWHKQSQVLDGFLLAEDLIVMGILLDRMSDVPKAKTYKCASAAAKHFPLKNRTLTKVEFLENESLSSHVEDKNLLLQAEGFMSLLLEEDSRGSNLNNLNYAVYLGQLTSFGSECNSAVPGQLDRWRSTREGRVQRAPEAPPGTESCGGCGCCVS